MVSSGIRPNWCPVQGDAPRAGPPTFGDGLYGDDRLNFFSARLRAAAAFFFLLMLGLS